MRRCRRDELADQPQHGDRDDGEDHEAPNTAAAGRGRSMVVMTLTSSG
jgi:hypothetical protein